MKLHTYLKSDGSFDYELYRSIQEAGNIRKIKNIWAYETGIRFLADYLRKNVTGPLAFGLCHGTRRGMEQAWFAAAIPGCEVLGTEISSTALQFPKTIQWDFHDTKPEWIGAVDFIYSNSWDHTYDPMACFAAWGSCLRPGGMMVLEHTRLHAPSSSSRLDPFGIELDEFAAMLTDIGTASGLVVREVMTSFPFEVPKTLPQLAYVVVERRIPPAAGQTSA